MNDVTKFTLQHGVLTAHGTSAGGDAFLTLVVEEVASAQYTETLDYERKKVLETRVWVTLRGTRGGHEIVGPAVKEIAAALNTEMLHIAKCRRT